MFTKVKCFLDKRFGLTEHKTSVKIEFIAGLTTFMAMVYILMVNAGMFTAMAGENSIIPEISYGAIYIATAISAVIGTLLIGLLSNLPLAQASGMGLNAFFVYTVVLGFGMSYANALVLVLIDGLVFIMLTLTGLRKKIFSAIPEPVRKAIPAGIGLFIAFIGVQNAGLLKSDESTLISLISFNVLAGAKWANIMPVLVTLITFIAMAVLAKKNVKGAVVYGILGGAILYYLLGFTVPNFYQEMAITFDNPFIAFKNFFTQSFGKVFTEGFDFSSFVENKGVGMFILTILTSSLSFCLVDMFDTIGTLYGACARGGMLTEQGEVPNMNKAMLADAIATCAGAICGTSTVTTFVESSSGVGAGGRTGLSSVFTAIFFFIAMFLSPVAMLIPGNATAAALIYVGVLMMSCVKDLDWSDVANAVPSFVTISIMVFTYNISFGIAFGILSYVLIAVFTGKAKKVNITTYVIALLFLAMFVLTH